MQSSRIAVGRIANPSHHLAMARTDWQSILRFLRLINHVE